MVRLVQCLCPARHAIMATAYEPETIKPEDAIAALRRAIAGALRIGALNPWCGICGARDSQWAYEDNQTRFHTIEDAKPELARLEQENAKAREMVAAQIRAARN